MSISANILEFAQSGFMPISLAALNEKAAMLERIDNKYVVKGPVLALALPEFSEAFDILEIKSQRSFIYETCYFDDDAQSSYLHHQQGRRNRAKVRMRRYAGTDLCFVEVKLKDTRGATIKKRLSCSPAIYGQLDGASMDFVRESYEGHYGKPFEYELSPSAQVRYRRMTLVAKTGGERMTIDSELEFDDGRTSCAISPGIHILETKSSCGNGLADRILRGLHQHPTKNCSKYCSGIALLQPGLKRNKFLPAIRKLSQLPVMVVGGVT